MTQSSSSKNTYHISFYAFPPDQDAIKILLFYRILTHLFDFEGMYYVPPSQEGNAAIAVLDPEEADTNYCSKCKGIIRQLNPKDVSLFAELAKRVGLRGPRVNIMLDTTCEKTRFRGV